MTTQPATCQAVKKNGAPCTAPVLGNASQCWAHDPALAEKRAATRRKGGQNKATAKRLDRLVPASLKPTIATLFDALQQVHTGELDPRQGQAMATIAGAIARLYGVGVLEERIAALEAAMTAEAGPGRQRAW